EAGNPENPVNFRRPARSLRTCRNSTRRRRMRGGPLGADPERLAIRCSGSCQTSGAASPEVWRLPLPPSARPCNGRSGMGRQTRRSAPGVVGEALMEPQLKFPVLLSIGAALVTLGLKTAAYLLTGSVGLLSDAAESLVNLVAATTAFASLYYAAR